MDSKTKNSKDEQLELDSGLSSTEIYEALRQSEDRYRELVENANSIILRWDKSGIITYFNEYAQKVFGYRADEVIGRHVLDTIVPESERGGRDLRPLMDDICNNPEKYQYNINENITKSGKRIWVAWTNKVLTNEQGEPIGAFSIGSDITEQRRLERELQHAHKMEAIGRLAGGMAHDFNNMLHGIMGYAEIIKSSAENPEQQESAEAILNTAQHASQLIGHLLAFSRKGKYRVVNCDMHAIVDEVISILKHTINKKVVIKREFAAENFLVTGDPAQLTSALLNLAINANDAMPEGGTLTFSTHTVSLAHEQKQFPDLEAGDYLVVKVIDTGIGMSEAVRSRIFEPFFTTKDTGQGTGMGLAAVYGTVQHHKGSVHCYSTSGMGSTFELLFPLVSTVETSVDTPATSESAMPKITLMLVDDEAIVRSYTKKLFEMKGHRVTTFSDPDDAIVHYKQFCKAIDLVILDMVMPIMDGKELFKRLKAINPEIKAILSTGYAIESQAQEVLSDGILDYIQKPFTLEQFEARVEPFFR